MSLARYKNALATSSGSPGLPKGMVAEMAWITASGSAATISVFVTPGATALTRMLSFASSPACECFLETEELVRGDEDDKA